MAVVFGVGSALVGVLLALLLLLFYSFHLFLSDRLAVICAGLWAVFALWLWVTLVRVGKTKRAARTSDHDLRVMSVLFFIVVFFNILLNPGTAKTEWQTVGLIFEWIVIMLHVIYFLLALCVWMRVPRAIWFRFVLSLLLVLWQTFSGHSV